MGRRVCVHVSVRASTGMRAHVSMRVYACARARACLVGVCVCDTRELEWRDAYVHVRVGT
jgi:hypothetical protein